MADADELVRVVLGGDGQLRVGRFLPGRGAWLCRGSTGCLSLAERRGAFSRALRAPVGAAAIGMLRHELAGMERPTVTFGRVDENRARMEGGRSHRRKD